MQRKLNGPRNECFALLFPFIRFKEVMKSLDKIGARMKTLKSGYQRDTYTIVNLIRKTAIANKGDKDARKARYVPQPIVFFLSTSTDCFQAYGNCAKPTRLSNAYTPDENLKYFSKEQM